MRIGQRDIGAGHLPLVIAEAGINHEGDVEKAIQLIDAAAAAGAECIKFQCHITEAEMVPTDMTPGRISDERLWDIIKRCELTEAEERRLKAYSESKGLLYLCTPFSREAADRLEQMGVAAYKIGSGECNNLPLIEHIARKGKPMLLSTGMNDPASIAPSVELIRRHGCPLALLHCTSMYPTPYAKVRLGAITQLRQLFGTPVGFSDHSLGIWTCLGAVAIGACVLEKHFTMSRQWPGPDTSMSIEPHELADLVVGSRAVFDARGGSKTILPEEQPVIDFAYASVVTLRSLRAGERFSLDNLWVKRPGNGPIHARTLPQILGKVSRRDLTENSQLAPSDIEGFE